MDITGYITKTVPFRFRGIDFSFDLSQGLFSSADIDSGTRHLLKVFSRLLDDDAKAGKNPPMSVLDAGCGCGVIGVCAAAAIMAMNGAANGLAVRAQDRDELARSLTAHNAGKNRIPSGVLQAYTEPLLAGHENSRWDLILCNIPAKAGLPVLEDFVRCSAAALTPDGRVVMVAVHTLADFFRQRIASAGAQFFMEEKSAEYSVFVYGGKLPRAALEENAPIKTGKDFFKCYPFYKRTIAECTLEKIPLRIETVYGAPGFDTPGGDAEATVKLISRIGIEKLNLFSGMANTALLIHEPGQGFFPCWLLEFLTRNNPEQPLPKLVLSGRNILGLEAARHNIMAAEVEIRPATAITPELGMRQKFSFIAAFPELIPQSLLPKESDQIRTLWTALPALLSAGSVFIAGFSSVNAERFDRVKPSGFSRLGDIKRKGFRALGYVFS